MLADVSSRLTVLLENSLLRVQDWHGRLAMPVFAAQWGARPGNTWILEYSLKQDRERSSTV